MWGEGKQPEPCTNLPALTGDGMSESCGSCGASTDREPLCEQCNDECNNDSESMAAEIERLRAENAELRESLRRIVGHLEYEVKQGDGLADDAVDDFVRAKSLLGQKVNVKAGAGA